MTISAQTNRYSYAGNGVTTAFAYSSKFLANADLVVLEVDDDTLVATTKTLTTDYTVSGAGNANGGTVTMLAAPATGKTLVIYNDPAITQTLDLVNGDSFDADDLEDALDRIVLHIRRLDNRLDRSLVQNDADISGAVVTVPPPEPGTILSWNDLGTALVNIASTSPASLREARRCPQNAQNGNYTLALADAGFHIYSKNAGAQTITIPLNASVAYDTGALITIVNNGTTAITIDDGGTTLKLAGTSSTGNRTLAVGGMATLLHVEDDVWFISGSGLS